MESPWSPLSTTAMQPFFGLAGSFSRHMNMQRPQYSRKPDSITVRKRATKDERDAANDWFVGAEFAQLFRSLRKIQSKLEAGAHTWRTAISKGRHILWQMDRAMIPSIWPNFTRAMPATFPFSWNSRLSLVGRLEFDLKRVPNMASWCWNNLCGWRIGLDGGKADDKDEQQPSVEASNEKEVGATASIFWRTTIKMTWIWTIMLCLPSDES